MEETEDPVTESARTTFGIPYLFPWQRLVIANILDAVRSGEAAAAGERETGTGNAGDELHDEDGALRGRQIILLPTGAGKSLCFQLPALMLERATLVVFPLLALMGDQKRRLAEGGLEPAFFRGGQSPEERDAQFARLEGRDGKPPAKLIIANPEILSASDSVISRIERSGVSHLAIDEAHCVSEWGDTFRPAYLELARVIERLDPPAVTAFTATASPPVLERIAGVLYGGRAHIVRGDPDRPNLRYSVYRCRAKEPALIREVARRQRPAVVFCATRGGTERAARILREAFDDTDIRYYHAGLLKEEKLETEAWFHAHERAILCCTCAWGMGVDKKNVRTVIHRDPPPTAEAYIQEAGRAGRDGKIAEAILLWSVEDAIRARNESEKMDDVQRRRALVLSTFAESGRCRREVLLEALGDPRTEKGAEEGVACSLCDVCDKTAVPFERDAALAAECVRKNKNAFSRDALSEHLYQAATRFAQNGSGIREWRLSDFSMMTESMLKNGQLRKTEHWPWRGKIAPGVTVTKADFRQAQANLSFLRLRARCCLSFLFRRLPRRHRQQPEPEQPVFSSFLGQAPASGNARHMKR